MNFNSDENLQTDTHTPHMVESRAAFSQLKTEVVICTVITDVLQNVNVFGFCFVLSHDIF